jgi:hypothetical protein
MCRVRRQLGCLAMTIEALRRQIEQRLTGVREETDRLQAALDSLGHGAADATPVDVGKPRRQSRAQAPQRRRRAPRGAARQAVLETLAVADAMTAGQLATVTGLPRERIAPELSKLVKTGELVKADRGYKTPTSEAAAATPMPDRKSPEVLALGRELDAGLRTLMRRHSQSRAQTSPPARRRQSARVDPRFLCCSQHERWAC